MEQSRGLKHNAEQREREFEVDEEVKLIIYSSEIYLAINEENYGTGLDSDISMMIKDLTVEG